MNKIETINPEEFLATTKAENFCISAIIPDYRLYRTRNGWMNPDVAPSNEYEIAKFNKYDLIESYYDACRDARDSMGYGSPFLNGSSIKIQEIS